MTSRQSNHFQRPLRVAFLTPSLHIGGAERWILALARNFIRVQPAGVVLCAPHFHPHVLQQAARLMPVYVARKLGDAGETRRLLQRACADADALVTWGVPGLKSVARRLVGRMGNPCYVPVIDVSHSDGAWEQQTRMVRRAVAGADFHVAVSRCAWAALGPEIRARATVIYNGVEVDRVAPRRDIAQQRRDWGIGESGKVALFLGRYDDVKGPLRLLRAVEHLPGDWTVVLHGHGPQEKQLRREAALEGDRVRVFGPVTHVGDVLAAADVFAMPSRFEGMPLALVEAWLAGTPAVTTPVGFVHEAEALHGALCEVVPQNPTGRQLADGILRAERGDHVEGARRAAWKYYTAGAMAQRWEEYLEAAVASFNRAPTGSASELVRQLE